MTNNCNDCVYCEKNEGFWGDSHECLKKSVRVNPGDPACRDFIYKSKGNEYERSGCYITTIICDILGYSDNCEVLNILRDFRERALKSNMEDLAILQEYDQVGPIISERIKQDEKSISLAMELLQGFIIPCTISIKQGNKDEAVSIYKNMVNMLKVKYCLVGIDIDLNMDTPIEILGKGRIRTQQKNEC